LRDAGCDSLPGFYIDRGGHRQYSFVPGLTVSARTPFGKVTGDESGKLNAPQFSPTPAIA
jgi:hypothetical protein